MTDVTTKKTALPLRNDTLFGVCEALGEDFGINPLWLRLAFIAPLFFAPLWTAAAYLGIGLLVAASRTLFPNKVNRVETPTVATPTVADDSVGDYKIAA